MSTRDQAFSSKWFNERKFRLTASKFGEILKSTENRNLEKFCESLYSPPNLSTPAVIHGKTYEPIAVELFEKHFQTKVSKCGLFVNEDFPNFAATPDGIVDEETLVEVKCPFSSRNEEISDSITFLEKNSSQMLQLKTDHKYYFQIQGQLAICRRNRCFLLVYTFKELLVLEIKYDDNFVKNMLKCLDKFYFETYLPFVSTKL